LTTVVDHDHAAEEGDSDDVEAMHYAPTMSDADWAKELAQRAVVDVDRNKRRHIQRRQDTELANVASFVSYTASQGNSGSEAFIGALRRWRWQRAVIRLQRIYNV
jgi:hypothetical protein